MNIRPHAGPGWPDETTLPIPLLTGADRAREFANTEAAVHDRDAPPYESAHPEVRAFYGRDAYEAIRAHAKQQPKQTCSACRDRCHTPQACQQPEVCAAFPLQPLFCRYPWLGPVMVACVVIVWTCLDAYLETNP